MKLSGAVIICCVHSSIPLYFFMSW